MPMSDITPSGMSVTVMITTLAVAPVCSQAISG